MKTGEIKTIVVDTNVYGWYLAYALDGSKRDEAINSFNLLSKILDLKKPIVLGTETVEREIKDANKPELSQLFYSIVRGIIKKTGKIDSLALDYYNSFKKEKLNLVTIDDCEIVAAVALSGVKIFIRECIENTRLQSCDETQCILDPIVGKPTTLVVGHITNDVITENRRTLNNPKVTREIEKVNARKNIRNVKITDSKSALGDVFA